MKARHEVIEIGSALGVSKLEFGAKSFDIVQLSNAFDLGFQLFDRVAAFLTFQPSDRSGLLPRQCRRDHLFRGSSLGSTYVIANGPWNVTWTIAPPRVNA